MTKPIRKFKIIVTGAWDTFKEEHPHLDPKPTAYPGIGYDSFYVSIPDKVSDDVIEIAEWMDGHCVEFYESVFMSTTVIPADHTI